MKTVSEIMRKSVTITPVSKYQLLMFDLNCVKEVMFPNDFARGLQIFADSNLKVFRSYVELLILLSVKHLYL